MLKMSKLSKRRWDVNSKKETPSDVNSMEFQCYFPCFFLWNFKRRLTFFLGMITSDDVFSLELTSDDVSSLELTPNERIKFFLLRVKIRVAGSCKSRYENQLYKFVKSLSSFFFWFSLHFSSLWFLISVGSFIIPITWIGQLDISNPYVRGAVY